MSPSASPTVAVTVPTPSKRHCGAHAQPKPPPVMVSIVPPAATPEVGKRAAGVGSAMYIQKTCPSVAAVSNCWPFSVSANGRAVPAAALELVLGEWQRATTVSAAPLIVATTSSAAFMPKSHRGSEPTAGASCPPSKTAVPPRTGPQRGESVASAGGVYTAKGRDEENCWPLALTVINAVPASIPGGVVKLSSAAPLALGGRKKRRWLEELVAPELDPNLEPPLAPQPQLASPKPEQPEPTSPLPGPPASPLPSSLLPLSTLPPSPQPPSPLPLDEKMPEPEWKSPI